MATLLLILNMYGKKLMTETELLVWEILTGSARDMRTANVCDVVALEENQLVTVCLWVTEKSQLGNILHQKSLVVYWSLESKLALVDSSYLDGMQ